ncbi:MAG: hypothetical protein HY900_03010 [Deltaproteobacteria bacterium]|nr:hypothetical protein [Deltaproteobacteria bacterium]
MKSIKRALSLCAVPLLLAACSGGGGGGGPGNGGVPPTQTAQVSFAVAPVTGQTPAAPVQAVELEVALPPGATVATAPDGKKIDATALTPGAGMANPAAVVSGTVANGVVKIGAATPDKAAIPAGGLQVATMTVTAPNANTLTAADFPTTVVQAAGHDVATATTRDVTAAVAPAVDVKHTGVP